MGKKSFYGALVLSSLLLLIPAFLNLYPLMNPDTGTYLASGFKPETPFDRPITYGIFIRLFSLNGLSLWGVVFFQAYIVCWLILKIIRNLLPGRPYMGKSILTIMILALCTPLSWLVSQVQPDLFTAIGVLCMVLILMNREGNGNRILLYFLFFVSVAMHLSHPLLFGLLGISLFLFKRLFEMKEQYMAANKRLLLTTVLSIAAIGVMGSAFSKSRHVFFVGSLLEKGILKKYLDENCTTSEYRLCAYRNELPAKADDFWWNENSALYKSGGWRDTRPEFNTIIHGVLTTPRYLQLYLAATAKQAALQARTFNIGDGNIPFPAGSNVNQCMKDYMPNELGRFNSDRQNAGSLDDALQPVNTFFSAVVILSLIGLVFIVLFRRCKTREMRLFLTLCILGLIYNCIDVAAFGVVNGRYGCKMIWLIPFCLLVYVLASGEGGDKKTKAAVGPL